MRDRKRVKIEFSRYLRKEQTKTEEILWWLIRKRKMFGFKFRRQHIINGFILDFYCPSIKLGIELDGKVHIKQKEYDKARQKIVEENGIKLIRFSSSDVINNPDEVLSRINENLPLLPSPLSGEGGPSRLSRDGG